MPKPEIDRLTKLAVLLTAAVAADDAASVAQLVEEGADPSFSAPGADSDAKSATPLWLALTTGKSSLVPLLLAKHRGTVPLASSSPQPVSVFEKLGEILAGNFDHERASRILAENLDLSSRAMRAAAWKVLKKSRDRFCSMTGDLEATSVAQSVVTFGATPTKMSSVIVALQHPIIGMSNWENPGVFASFVIRIPGSSQLFAYWISRGLSPETVIGGLPLLHHAAFERDEQLAQVLLSAGADPSVRATSKIAVSELSRAKQPVAADGCCTALELASAVGAQGVSRAIQAASARSAIDQVLARARQGAAPQLL